MLALRIGASDAEQLSVDLFDALVQQLKRQGRRRRQ